MPRAGFPAFPRRRCNLPRTELIRVARFSRMACLVLVVVVSANCTGAMQDESAPGQELAPGQPDQPASAGRPRATALPPQTTGPSTAPDPQPPTPRRGAVTLGFAGDVHFAGQLSPLLRRPRTALEPIAPALRQPDLMMVNLETAITRRGSPEPKEYQFRTSARALEALDAAGVDVVSMGNNHAVDYGAVGLRDTLAAVRGSPIGVVGIGEDAAAAFRPYVVSIRGTRIAVLAATTLPDRTALAWAAGREKPGVAVAFVPRPRLTRAVRAANEAADVVVVYLHWGEEGEACPYWRPLLHARELAAAGADIVVGSHAHVLLGAGWLNDTYVDYGLGNFAWYNQATMSTGILTLTVRRGHVVADSFAPAQIYPDGRPRLLHHGTRADAVHAWRQLRGCTGLAPHPRR